MAETKKVVYADAATGERVAKPGPDDVAIAFKGESAEKEAEAFKKTLTQPAEGAVVTVADARGADAKGTETKPSSDKK